MKLRTKLTVIFTVAFFLLALMIFILNFCFTIRSIKNYKKELQEKTNTEMLHNIENALNSSDGDLSRLDSVLNSYKDELNFEFKLLNQVGDTLYETQSRIDNHGRHFGSNRRHQRIYKGEYITCQHELEAPKFGKVKLLISYYEYSLVEEDISFRYNLVIGMFLSTVIGFGIIIILGVLLSDRIAKPIQKMQAATDNLRQGDLSSRVNVRTETRELDDLIDSINHLAASLERQENLRKRLTSDVSHELRTPLNVLQNQLVALIDGIWEADAERLSILQKEVQRLIDLVKDIEKLTHLDTDKDFYKFTLHDLKYVIKETIMHFKPAFSEKNIEICIEEVIPGVSYKCYMDIKRIKQVIVNLLSNSLKFAYSYSKLKIRLDETHDKVIFSIEDEGIGIPESDLNNVFERFYRAENSRSRESGGAGLGLAIVYEIIQKHQGMINIDSEEKKGTKITVYLPKNRY